MPSPFKVGARVTVATDQAFSHKSYRDAFHKHCAGHPATIRHIYTGSAGEQRAHIFWQFPDEDGETTYFAANLLLTSLTLLK